MGIRLAPNLRAECGKAEHPHLTRGALTRSLVCVRLFSFLPGRDSSSSLLPYLPFHKKEGALPVTTPRPSSFIPPLSQLVVCVCGLDTCKGEENDNL